jgi:hypothetical protein
MSALIARANKMAKDKNIIWLDDVEEHDYPAAASYPW